MLFRKDYGSQINNAECARKILKKAELALLRERIAWTRRQLCGLDERIVILTEELWMTLNKQHYSTAKRMIPASSTRTFNKARSTQIAKFTKLTSYGQGRVNSNSRIIILTLMKIRAYGSKALRQ